MPLSELKQISIAIEDQRYDEELRRVTQWTRRATLSFSGKKDITFDPRWRHRTEDRIKPATSIDRVLLAVASYGQPS